MIIENPNNYKFVKFEKSKIKKKKYDTILQNNVNGNFRRVPFGQIGYQQYKDATGLKLYSNLNHLDKERRRLYRLRHDGEAKNKFSSGYWSWKYLW